MGFSHGNSNLFFSLVKRWKVLDHVFIQMESIGNTKHNLFSLFEEFIRWRKKKKKDFPSTPAVVLKLRQNIVYM